MSEIEIILTVISVLGTISSILFAYLAFARKNKDDTHKDAKSEGVLLSDVGYIKSSIDRVEKTLDQLRNKYDDLHTRLVMLEEKVNNHIEDYNIHVKGGKQ